MHRGFSRELLGVLAVLAALFIGASQAFVQGYLERARISVATPVSPSLAAIDQLVVASAVIAILTGILMLLVAATAVEGATRVGVGAGIVLLTGAAMELLISAAPGEIAVLGAIGLALAASLVSLAFVALVFVIVLVLWHAGRGTLDELVRLAVARPIQVRTAPATESAPPGPTQPRNTNLDLLRMMLDYARRSFESESDRTRAVEVKANALISALGVVAVFTVNAAGLFFLKSGDAAVLTGLAKSVAVLLYVATALSLGWALIWSLRAAAVVRWQRPAPDVLDEMNRGPLATGLTAEIDGLRAAQASNQSRNDQLVDRIRWAQVGLLLGSTGLLGLALLLATIAAMR